MNDESIQLQLSRWQYTVQRYKNMSSRNTHVLIREGVNGTPFDYVYFNQINHHIPKTQEAMHKLFNRLYPSR